jgi:hypothetical protein
MRRLLLVAGIAALLAAAFVAFAQADPGTQSGLTAISGQGSGFVEVAPTAMNEGIFTYDVQGTVNIDRAAPNTAFTVLRGVDFTADGICTGSPSLTLPGNPVLTTSAGGAGALHYEIHALLFEGVKFDVIYRVVGTDGTVLVSDCFTVTVK